MIIIIIIFIVVILGTVIAGLTGVCKPEGVHRVTIAPPLDYDSFFPLDFCMFSNVWLDP